MENYSTAREYFKRLKRLINSEADFTLFGYKFVKIKRVEDMLACVLGTLPDSYRKAMKMKSKSLYRSVVAFNALNKLIKQKFFLVSDCYMIDYGEANVMLDAIISTIEIDIDNIENLD